MDVEERWEISQDLYLNLMKMSKSDQYQYIYKIADLTDRYPVAYGFHNPRVINTGNEYFIVWRRRSGI